MDELVLLGLGAAGLYLLTRPSNSWTSDLSGPGPDGETLDQIFDRMEFAYELTGIYGRHILKAIAKVESNFNPDAKGSHGERGMMQLMPGAIIDTGMKYTGEIWNQVEIAAAYLKIIDERNPNSFKLRKLAMYNAGKNIAAGAYYAVRVAEIQSGYQTEGG